MSSRKPYDVNKHRLYAAENKCHPGREFFSVLEAERWGKSVFYIDPLFSGTRPAFKKSHGNRNGSCAHLHLNEIHLSEFMLDEQTVLHELAHFTVDHTKEAYHGSSFCWNYADLTLRWRGVDAYLELRNAMRAEGIF